MCDWDVKAGSMGECVGMKMGFDCVTVKNLRQTVRYVASWKL